MAMVAGGLLRPETAEDRARRAYANNAVLRREREAAEKAAREASPRYQAAIAKRARKAARRLDGSAP